MTHKGRCSLGSSTALPMQSWNISDSSPSACAQVSEEEAAAGMGAEWPHLRTLAELQRQAYALSHEVADMRQRGAPGAARMCATLLGILATAARLQACFLECSHHVHMLI